MACGARWGLKLKKKWKFSRKNIGLNGLWSPLGIETFIIPKNAKPNSGLNGLWSPLGIETCRRDKVHQLWNIWLNGLWSPLGIETFIGDW